MIKAHRIVLERVDGQPPQWPADAQREAGEPAAVQSLAHKARSSRVEFTCLNSEALWSDANEVLLIWSQTAPRSGQPHRVEFVIHYTDTLKYRGVYSLYHWSSQMPDLGTFLADIVTLKSGANRPGWAPKWFWAWVLEISSRALRYYEQFAASHEIGQDQLVLDPTESAGAAQADRDQPTTKKPRRRTG